MTYTVRQPVHPLELSNAGNALQSVRPCLQDEVVRLFFGEEEFGPFDAAECAFDHRPEHVTHRRWPVQGTVKVPPTETKLLCDSVKLFVIEWFVGRAVGLAVAKDGRVEKNVAD